MTDLRRMKDDGTGACTDDLGTDVIYKGTRVVHVYVSGEIRLDTGGWKTHTTKRRMNQASTQYDLGYRVYQKAGAWFVHFDGKDIPFNSERLWIRK